MAKLWRMCPFVTTLAVHLFLVVVVFVVPFSFEIIGCTVTFQEKKMNFLVTSFHSALLNILSTLGNIFFLFLFA